MTETNTLPRYTAEQLAKMKKARKGTYLTAPQLAEYMSRSVPWVNLQIKQGTIKPNAILSTGKRGRPSHLFKKGEYAQWAKDTSKRTYTKRAA